MTFKTLFVLIFSAGLTACAARFDFNKAGEGGTLTATSVSIPEFPDPMPDPSPDPTPASHSEKGLYLCILDGPGKNTRIGYLDSELIAANGAPTDVCMSQNACLNIVSKAFPVSEDFSHPCSGLLHQVAIEMTDAQIQTLIDKALTP